MVVVNTCGIHAVCAIRAIRTWVPWMPWARTALYVAISSSIQAFDKVVGGGW